MISTYIKKEETTQIQNPNLHLSELEKEQTKTKVSRRKEIINIRAEINKIENRKTTRKKINETELGF